MSDVMLIKQSLSLQFSLLSLSLALVTAVGLMKYERDFMVWWYVFLPSISLILSSIFMRH